MDRFDTVRDLIDMTFGVSQDQITPDTVQTDIINWDSVGHLNLMIALEDTFDIRLHVEDMVRLNSVKAILDYLEAVCPSG